jgi:poly-gamma-glutamate capsule biosynthesis protein CapA/YwtB (metallophosphatase superfamily)
MNAQRRKELNKAIDLITNLKEQASALAENIEAARELVEQVKDEEQEAFDNMPESLQSGDKGQTMEAAISSMDDVHGDLENLKSEIESMDWDDLISKLDEAAGVA